MGGKTIVTRNPQQRTGRNIVGSKDIRLEPNATGADRIDTASDEALRIWAQRLDASPDQIREAVDSVGDRASDVELHLKGSRSTTNNDRVDAAK